MPVNWVRGFRRIGWILTFPMSAFFVLAFYHDMKEFSVSDYRVRQIEAHSVLDILDKSAVEIPKSELGFRGIAYFSQEVPSDVTARIVADFLKNRRPKAEEMEFTVDGKRELPQGTIWDDADVVSLQFTVYQRVNKLKLAGLILGSVLISALIIQGSISIFAWIFRGFKGQ